MTTRALFGGARLAARGCSLASTSLWRRSVRCAVGALLCACASLDDKLLEPDPSKAGLPPLGDASADSSAAGRPTESGSGGAGGMGVDSGAGLVDGGPDGSAPAGDGGACHPNPNPMDEVCPLVCPESCDGRDDDCDLKIDEGEANNGCAAPNALIPATYETVAVEIFPHQLAMREI